MDVAALIVAIAAALFAGAVAWYTRGLVEATRAAAAAAEKAASAAEDSAAAERRAADLALASLDVEFSPSVSASIMMTEEGGGAVATCQWLLTLRSSGASVYLHEVILLEEWHPVTDIDQSRVTSRESYREERSIVAPPTPLVPADGSEYPERVHRGEARVFVISTGKWDDQISRLSLRVTYGVDREDVAGAKEVHYKAPEEGNSTD